MFCGWVSENGVQKLEVFDCFLLISHTLDTLEILGKNEGISMVWSARVSNRHPRYDSNLQKSLNLS